MNRSKQQINTVKSRLRRAKVQRLVAQHTNQVLDESVYRCEVCLITDDSDKVCCDECNLWFHFACVNVGSEVENRYWACITCEGTNGKESTRMSIENIPIEHPATATDDVSHKGSEQNVVGNVNPSTIENTNRPQPAKSTSSSISRRAALALQRLEEENQLRERRQLEDQARRDKHDREYLDKKYSLMQLESDDDDIIAVDEELNRLKQTRLLQWSKKLPQANQGKVIGLPGQNSALRSLAVGPGTKKNVNEVYTSKSKCNWQDLPAWLRHPGRAKAVSTMATIMSGTTSISSTAPPQASEASNIGTQTQSGGMNNHAQPTVMPTVPIVSSNSQLLNVQGSNIRSSGNHANQLPKSMNRNTNTRASEPQTFYFGLRPTTASQPFHSNVNPQSIDTSSQPRLREHESVQTVNCVNVKSSAHLQPSALNPSTSENIQSSIQGQVSAAHSTNSAIQSKGYQPYVSTWDQGKSTDYENPMLNPKGKRVFTNPALIPTNQFVSNSSVFNAHHQPSTLIPSTSENIQLSIQGQVSTAHSTNSAIQSSGYQGTSTDYKNTMLNTISKNGFTNPALIPQNQFVPNDNATAPFTVSSLGSEASAIRFGSSTGPNSVYTNPPPIPKNQIVSTGLNMFANVNSSGQTSQTYWSASDVNSAPRIGSSTGPMSVYAKPPSSQIISTGPDTYSNSNSSGQTHQSYQQYSPYCNVSQNAGWGNMFPSTSSAQATANHHGDNGNVAPMGTIPANTNVSASSAPRARLTAEMIAARHVMPKLPHFHGDCKKWQAFISAFEHSTTECGFTNVENLGRLQECLKGDADDAVGSRLLHPDAVPAVINTLKLMYGRPELIIESLIEKIKGEPTPKDDDLASLIKFAISVQNLCGSIQETGAVEHLRNPTLMNTITDKLPTQIQLNWAFHRHSIGVVDLATLGNWLYGLADVASQVVRKTSAKPAGKKKENDKTNLSNSKSRQGNYLNTQVENQFKKQPSEASRQSLGNKCPACKSESCSKIYTCKKFKNLPRSDKWAIVKEQRLCARCLGGHSFYRCRSELNCKVDGCTKKHHTLLHDNGKSAETSKEEKKSTASANNSTPNSAEQKTPTSVCNSQRSKNNRTDIFRIVPVVLYHKKKVVREYAYLDEGSNLTLMEDALADELELVGTPESVCIDWAFGQSHESDESRIVSTKISGFYPHAQSYKMGNVRTVKSLHLPTQTLTTAWIERYPHLKNLPIVTYEAAKPRMMIGLQYSKLTVPLETVEGEWEEPIACRTRLGWVLQGPSYDDKNHQAKKRFSLNLCHCQSKDNRLHQMVKEYFSIENFGVKMNDKFLESKQVQRARQLLEATTVKKDGRYESGLLWKYDEIDLPNSYDMALKRLRCLESKMAKNPPLAENLCNQIKQFVDKGYIRKLLPNELEVNNDRKWYLPIFPVFNPKKPEKIRIVWDAAAKVKNVSLNSMLLTGPDLLVPLVDILRRFRERLIAILGDIKEMYHQIKIIERDQNVQRFLWRDGDSSRQPDVYVMLVSTFGAACSPCTAQFVKNKNANEYKEKFPEAVNAIINSTYVDDLLDCVHKLEEALKLVGDVKYVNLQGGFETTNFLSNSKEVLKEFGGRDTLPSKNLNISTEVTLGMERVLGMFWNAEADTFTYSLKYTQVNQNLLNGTHCPTKREVLRVLMSIFDPLGLLANFLVYAKILLQEIWRNATEWDEPIKESLYAKWIKWITALKAVESVQIPRLYSPKMSPGTPNSIQLHVFVDASIEAYAAAAYFRIEDDNGIDCCLVGAKTKVAPNKPMSVPRLELQAGVLGTRLSTSITSSQRLKIEKVIFWSDSKTVMGWINSEARRYHQFVAFRIGEILEITESTQWRWVPSEHNVADEATKSRIQKLDSSSRWFKAPNFLYDEEKSWFTEENQNEHHTEEEMRPSFVMACRQGQTAPLIDVKRFSQWNRLVRAMAYVFRFIHNAKSTEKRTGPLLQEEIIQGENQLYRLAQQDHYLDEIAILERNATLRPEEQKYLEKSSELYNCSPYLDDHGVLRVKGRTDAAKCLSFDAKRPIIMPRRHCITKLIVNHYHRLYLHLNHQTAINEVRQKFEIAALRVVMKEVRNACQKCKNASAVPRIPEMAELPFARLAAFERPYTYVGIDYFGPYKVKLTRNCSASRWGVLYTCLTTRAIHLEVAHSLSTSSCIMAFERFGNSCGYPREVYSDNGTNFHGMDNELKEEFKKLKQEDIQQKFTSSELKWSFNPPLSPHMGGAWERLILTVKSCLKKVVTTRNPTDETLPTLFAQVENIVNSRPLTYVSLDSVDDEVLTPNHFLFGSSNGRKPICNTTPRDLNRNEWKSIQEQTNQFWKCFVLEYMPTLTKRTKWFKQSKPVEVGDVVIIVDETNPKNTWPKGIVEQTFIGKGGKRRQALVRAILETKNGPVHKEYKRSVHKLAVLDVKVLPHENVKRQPVESINEGDTVGQH